MDVGVLFGERMTVFALVQDRRDVVAAPLQHVAHVVLLRPYLKVVKPEADPVVALVAHNHSFDVYASHDHDLTMEIGRSELLHCLTVLSDAVACCIRIALVFTTGSA